MPDPSVVQRFIPPPGCRLLAMGGSSDDQAGVQVRDLYKDFKRARAEALDFTLPMTEIASFPGTLNWDVRQPREDLPRIMRASRQSGPFLLIVMGGGGSCLIAEILCPDAPLTSRSLVRLHPYPLHLPLKQSLRIDEISFGISAGNHAGESHISIEADPGIDPGGTAGPSTSHNHSEPTPSERAAILEMLDQEILAWGDIFAAVHETRLAGHAQWPTDLCRHVLPDKEFAAELARIVKAVAIRAYEKFVPESLNELVVGLSAPNRPSPLASDDHLPWSAFVNLRGEIVPGPMQAWIETTLSAVLEARRPEGWFEVIGPDQTSRLGVQSQLRKTFATIRGPFSNHQRMEVMSVLGSLYQA